MTEAQALALVARLQEKPRRIDMGLITRLVPEIDHFATGELFRSNRIKAKLSVRALARRLKLSAAFVSDLERGRRNWTEQRAKDFSDAIMKGAK